MNNKVYFWGYIIILALYVTLALALPPNPDTLKQYEITQAQSRLLNLTIIAPITLIYLTAMYGFLRFRKYAQTVKDSPEGQPFTQLASGLTILAFSLPILGIASSFLSYTEFHRPELLEVGTIARNYLMLLFSFTAFLLISKGATGLVGTLKSKKFAFIAPSLLGVIVLSSIFTFLVATTPDIAVNDARATYYLPDWLVVATIVIPYLYVWCLGIMAAQRLRLYSDKVKGIVYKNAMSYLARGTIAIIFLSVFIQLLTTLSARLNRLELTPLLLIVYLLVALYALGYGLVARGAKKLKDIEEV